MQPTKSRPGQLVARLTVRKTVVHLVSVLEVYAEPAPSSSPVIQLRRAAGSRGFALNRVLGLLAVFAALLVLLSLTACGGASIESVDSTREPVCIASTYEAGGNRDACGSANVNPIVLECDAPPTPGSIAHYIGGVDIACSPGAVPNTMCCVGAP